VFLHTDIAEELWKEGARARKNKTQLMRIKKREAPCSYSVS
jgi:hypothetical protein